MRPYLKSEKHVACAKGESFLSIKTSPKNEKLFTIKINDGPEIKFDSPLEPLWYAQLINSIGEVNDQY